ncbi:MAG: glycosyltransferase [Candidatus Rokuibacteriota bacterium]
MPKADIGGSGLHRRLRLVVLGMMGRCPWGGQTWLFLNWLRGLHRLGHEVWYVEDDTVWPYDPVRGTVTDDCAYAVGHIADCMKRIGLPDRWAFRLAGRDGACWGLSGTELGALYGSADALLNVCGAVDLREDHLKAPLRIYIETDPVTSELRLANGDEQTRAAFAAHDVLVTYGENYGAPDCGVPLGDLRFLTIRQPVDLALWPMAFEPAALRFTTIGNYRQEGGDVPFGGEVYRWSKHHEWEKIMELPLHTTQELELALNVAPADGNRLQAHRWRVVSPVLFSLDVFGAYPEYIRSSRAELTVAKDQNVRLRSGWFSERDACYLASGKPVVAQDTGFSRILPTGQGLFAFSTMDQALAAIEAINGDYPRHCKAARAIAEEYFEAPRVAARLLAGVGLG